MVNGGDFKPPAATTTFAGTVAAAGLLQANVIEAPPAGAGAFKETKFCDLAGGTPPTTSTGAKLTAATPTGLIVTVVVAVAVPYIAVITTCVGMLTKPAVMVNEAEVVAYAASVTEAGTEAAAGLELERAAIAPTGGAWPFNTTAFASVDNPLTMLAADKRIDVGDAGLTVSVAREAAP